MIFTIDPGVRGAGLALFLERTPQAPGQLVAATYVRVVGDGYFAEAVELSRKTSAWLASKITRFISLRVILEFPKVYPHSEKRDKKTGKVIKVDPNDLVNLGAAAYATALGAESFNVGTFTRVYPRDWKGTMDGDAMTERIRDRLTPPELAALDPAVPASLAHNMLDAVGIGLWDVDRLERVRVFPGATLG